MRINKAAVGSSVVVCGFLYFLFPLVTFFEDELLNRFVSAAICMPIAAIIAIGIDNVQQDFSDYYRARGDSWEKFLQRNFPTILASCVQWIVVFPIMGVPISVVSVAGWIVLAVPLACFFSAIGERVRFV